MGFQKYPFVILIFLSSDPLCLLPRPAFLGKQLGFSIMQSAIGPLALPAAQGRISKHDGQSIPVSQAPLEIDAAGDLQRVRHAAFRCRLPPHQLPQFIIRIVRVLQLEQAAAFCQMLLQPLGDLPFTPGIDIHVPGPIQIWPLFLSHNDDLLCPRREIKKAAASALYANATVFLAPCLLPTLRRSHSSIIVGLLTHALGSALALLRLPLRLLRFPQ